MIEAVLGIDVGTGSARAGVFDLSGRMLGHAARPIQIWHPAPHHVEQSSDDIWRAVTTAVREALALAGPDVRVLGIGFDATCSLVAIDNKGLPVAVNAAGDDRRNVIVWMDHRATAIVNEINAQGHAVLDYVGGRLSPEMQTPKLAWLARERPEAFARAAHFFDLPDFLTWKATGSTTRSLCSLVCKWTYLGHEGHWDEAYFRAIGLERLADEGFRRIGTEVKAPGEMLDKGLAPEVAEAWGLAAGLPVAASAIDAHAGGIGVLGGAVTGEAEVALDRRLALITGTSTCHMAVSPAPRFAPGIWGPYYSAMVPGLWLNEGGQSATGALTDHIIAAHAEGARLLAEEGHGIYSDLNQRLATLAGSGEMAVLTRDLHVLPDFHGNRSPRADPSLKGMITGLGLSAGMDDLALLYLAVQQALAYGTRHIIDVLNREGYRIDTLVACGGGTKNPVLLAAHAEATQCRILLPEAPDAVVLGAAMLGAVAAGSVPSVESAMAAMSRISRVIEPRSGTLARYHDAKYKVFLRLHEDQLAYRALMAGAQ